jgi:hypothetical protein
MYFACRSISLFKPLFLIFLLALQACTGGNGTTPQTIAFAIAGPVSLVVGDTLANAASGPGSGAVSYSSSNTVVATVDGAGTAKAVGSGKAMITATKAADSVYMAATATYEINVVAVTPPSNRTISFETETGPLCLLVGDTLANVASGPGSGAVSYSSSDTAIVTVDSAGLATVVGPGSAVVTATKAPDPKYLSTTASYAIHSSSNSAPASVPFTAWIGSTNTQINFPTTANGMTFYHSSEANCDLTNYMSCVNGQMDILTGATVTDNAVTLSQAGYYVLQHDSHQCGVAVSTQHFSRRSGHQAVLFKNQLWLIGGDSSDFPYNYNNDVWSSRDGINWVQRTAAAAFSPRAGHQVFVFKNQIWLIGGSSNDGSGDRRDVWSSSDGINWTPQNGFLPHFGSIVVFNNKLWLIGGEIEPTCGTTCTPNYKNDVWSSSDGITWTQETAAATFSARSGHRLVVYNNKMWLIGGDDGILKPISPNDDNLGSLKNDVWSSTDGITWVQQTAATAFPARSDFTVVVYNNQLWLIGGYQGGFYKTDVWSSNDGINWSQQTAAAAFYAGPTQVMVYNNQLWLIAGENNTVWSSSDGIIWMNPATADPFKTGSGGYQAVTFNNELWLIGGSNSTGNQNEVWSSSDGITWVQRTAAAAFSPRINHKVVVYNNKLWLIGGQNHGYLNDVWSSSDGITWTQQTAAAAFSPRRGQQVVVYNNELWLIGGGVSSTASSTGWRNDVWSSSDGITWIQKTPSAAFSPRADHQVIVYDNQLWLIAGGENTSSAAYPYSFTNDIWSSIDGITWTQRTAAAAFGKRAGHQVVVYNNQLWLIAGLPAKNDVWSSSDGVTWAQQTATAAFSPGAYQVVVYKNKMFLPVGWSSSDGIDWRRGYRGTIKFP